MGKEDAKMPMLEQGQILKTISGVRIKVEQFIAEGGQLAGASKVGYILSKIAFVFGIISLVCYAIIIIACIASPEFRSALLAEYGF